MVPFGDGTDAGLMVGRFWLGELTFKQLMAPDAAAGVFLRHRSSQLLYPLLISPQPLIGWNIQTHVLVLNTILGAILVMASYAVGLRLHGKSYAVLVALLTCSVTGPYWVARWGLVDNLFYAAIPLFALSAITWLRHRTVKTLALMFLGTATLAVTRPESMLIIGFVALVFVWTFLRQYFSRRAVAVALLLSLVTAAIGTTFFLRSSASLQKKLLSTSNISWGLALSAATLFNRGQEEFDQVVRKYTAIQNTEQLRLMRARMAVDGEAQPRLISVDFDLPYRMSTDAIGIIKAHPFWFLLKIPIRGVALLFPWTYQLWSLPHVLYEAAYTIFLTVGFVLLVRRGTPETSLLVLVAIPLSILCFLSVFGIDNDLKHRNGILIGLNLIAPLGYCLHPRAKRRVNHERTGSPSAIATPSRATSA